MRAKIFKGTVLLITGDDRLQHHLEKALLSASFGVRTTRSQEEALEELRAGTPAVIVVDRRQSGFSRLRQELPVPPPIMTVTYHQEACDEHHCVMDLEDGATRAVCNTSPALIVGLIGAVLRRRRWDELSASPCRYVSQGVTVDLDKCEAMLGQTPVHLSRTEFRILECLIATPGHYLSRQTLLDQVWGEGFAIFPHVLDVHIWSLRRKLDPHRVEPELITTIKGSGFRLRSMSQHEQAPPIQLHPVPALRVYPLPLFTRPPARPSAMAIAHWSRHRAQSLSARFRSTHRKVSPDLIFNPVKPDHIS